MNIIQDLIPVSNGNRPRHALTPTFITIHETANTSLGANAEMHARYVKNPTTAASWHFTVDSGTTIYQHLPLNENGWHAGDGRNGTGNRQSIGIEICVNRDGDFEKAKQNAAILVRQLMDQFSISIENVVPHQRWSGKRCPANIINTGGIEAFRRLIPANEAEAPVELPNEPAPTPLPPVTGGSIVSWMNGQGLDSSYANRARLAAQYGIADYRGTAEQNTRLLQLLQSGQLPVEESPNSPAPTPTPPASGGSIVSWMNAQGLDSSYANRARLAAQYGITNYTGTAAQNTRLLELLQRGQAPNPPRGNQNTTSIVTYLNSIGVDSSYTNRARLASQNGIRNYSGTSAQNTQLLNLLRSGGSTVPGTRPPARQGEGIVSYLNRVGIDSSYANRERLAKQYGIANYRGTAAQNSELLNRISG